MKRPYITTALIFWVFTCLAQNNQYEIAIKSALQAAPEGKREGAAVLVYDENGMVVTAKKGENEIICLADNPKIAGFNAACYHKDLEPFMARGRTLKDEGKSPQEIFNIREQEVQDGKLVMPDHPSTLHILYGPDAVYDKATEKVTGAKYRYVIYIPYATPESTGLLTRPRNPGDPWLMDPGTHRAHIMVTPPSE